MYTSVVNRWVTNGSTLLIGGDYIGAIACRVDSSMHAYVLQGAFRGQLYYAIAVIKLKVKPHPTNVLSDSWTTP